MHCAAGDDMPTVSTCCKEEDKALFDDFGGDPGGVCGDGGELRCSVVSTPSLAGDTGNISEGGIFRFKLLGLDLNSMGKLSRIFSFPSFLSSLAGYPVGLRLDIFNTFISASKFAIVSWAVSSNFSLALTDFSRHFTFVL